MRSGFLKSFYAEPLVASIISASTGKYIDVNIRFEEFFGLNRKEVIGKSPLELNIWARKSHSKKAVMDFLQKESFGKLSLRVVAAGGEIKDVFAVTESINFKGEDCYLGRLYDVTGHIEASKKIKEGEETFKNLLEHSPDLIYEFKIQGQSYRYVSPSSAEIVGVLPETFLKQRDRIIKRLIHEDDKKRIAGHFKNIFTRKGSGKRSYYIEFRIKTDSNENKWLADNHTVVFDKNHRPECIVGNIRDITYRKNAQEELLKSYELQKGYSNLLTSIQDALPANIAMLDKEGNIVAVNESWRNSDRFNRLICNNHAIGKNYISVCQMVKGNYSREAREAAKGIKKVLNGTLNEFQIEYSCHTSSVLRWFRLLVSPIGKNKPSGAVVMHIDTTNQKQAELALKNSEEQYRLLFYDNPQPMFIYDTETMRIIAVNKTAISHYGYPEKEFLKLNLLDIRPQNERARFQRHWKKEMKSRMKYQSGFVGTWKHMKKNGEIIDVEITRAQVDFGGRKAILILVNDVTEKIAAERNLKKKNNEIELLYKAGKKLSSTLETEKMLDNIYSIVKENLPCDTMVISSYSNKEKLIKCLAVWQDDVKLDASVFPPIGLSPKGFGIQSEAIRTGKARIITDMKKYAQKASKRYYFKKDGTYSVTLRKGCETDKSAMIVPLMLEGKPIGVIQVLSSKKDSYTNEDLKMLEAFSSQLSASTANTKLYSQAQSEIKERKKAEDDLRKKNAESEFLYRAEKELASTLDTTEIYDKIYKIVSEMIPCSSMLISSYDSHGSKISCIAAWIKDTKLDVSKFPNMPLDPSGKGIQSKAIITGKSIIVENFDKYAENNSTVTYIYKDNSFRKKLKKSDNVNRSGLFVPMVLKGRVIGVIQVLSTESKIYTNEHLQLLEALSAQISTATTNAKLYRQSQNEIIEREKAEAALQKKSEEISVLYEAQKELTGTLDLESVYENSYRIISGLMNCDTMMVSTYDKNDNMIRVINVWTEGFKPELKEMPPIPLAPEGFGIQSRVIRTGEPLLILDYDSYYKKTINKYTFNDSELKKETERVYSSAMIVPMKIERRTIGTIQVLSAKANAYTENDLRMLESLTTHITSATANAQLYSLSRTEISERKKAQKELEKKTKEITRLYEAERDLASSLEPEKIYDTLYRHMRKIIPCDSMVISSYSESDNLIRCSSAWVENTKHDAAKFPAIEPEKQGKGTQGETIRTGNSMIINNFDEVIKDLRNKQYFDADGNLIDYEKNRERIDNSAIVTRSALFVPMKLKGKVVGVITAFSYDANAYNENHLRLLETLSAQVTAVTLNSMLYQQAQNEIKERAKAEERLRERSDEITLLYEVYHDLTSTLDTKVIYSKVYEVIRKIMPCDAMSILSFEKLSGDLKFVSLWQDNICHDTSRIPIVKYDPQNVGILTKLIKTGIPEIHNNYYEEVQKSPTVITVDNEGEISKEIEETYEVPVTRSAILVPMKIENSIIGVITVYSYEKNAYRDENLKILEALTTQLSSATLNAMLYQQAQKEIEERIKKEEELTSIRKNLEEAQKIAHIGSWFYDDKTGLISNSVEIHKILGIDTQQEGFEFDKAMQYVHEDDRLQTMNNIKEAISNKKSYVNEDRIVRPDGEIRYVKLMGEPTFDEKGNYQGIHGTMQDITEIKLINEELLRSLNEKEMMLKEIHHRVKNNLQVVSSLLRLQSDKIADSSAVEYLKQSEQRVKSMALIHQQLYRTKDLSKIDFREYLKELCSYLMFAYGVTSQKISLHIGSDEIYFGIDTALPCGLIVNELLTNSIKHAFPGNRTGNISLMLSKDENGVNHLTVKDDGIGGKLDFKNAETLGLELVNTLTEQLDGEITTKYQNGVEITISFPDQVNKSTH